MKTNTFNLIMGVLLVSSSMARAGDVIVYDAPFSGINSTNSVSATFEVNEEHPELHRAWIKVSKSYEEFDGERETRILTENKNIPDLTFDAKKGQVVYAPSGGGSVVCAELRPHRFLVFNYTKLEPTGSCVLKGVVDRRNADDGFHLKGADFARVVLSTSERKPASE